MFVLMFALWIIFNGKFTAEIALFGLAVSALVFWFLCRFMDYSLKKEAGAYRGMLFGLKYIILLICEIFKANFYVMNLILSSKYIIEPKLLRFRTGLREETARVVLANSITLTPGTITVTLEGDEYLVHCLDRELGEGIENCSFEKRLEELERMKAGAKQSEQGASTEKAAAGEERSEQRASAEKAATREERSEQRASTEKAAAGTEQTKPGKHSEPKRGGSRKERGRT